MDNAGIGGQGGAGSTIDGTNGEGYLDPAPDVNSNGGGGGGGCGWITIKYSTEYTGSGITSPEAIVINNK